MPSYFVKVVFNDEPTEQSFDLTGLDHEESEAYTADLRYQVEEAKNINAPVIVMSNPALEDLTLDPRRIVSIDLQEND